MARYEVLYNIHEKLDYPKISAIKPVGWKWGSGELDDKIFAIKEMELTDQQVKDFWNENKIQLSSKDTRAVDLRIVETAVKDRKPLTLTTAEVSEA